MCSCFANCSKLWELNKINLFIYLNIKLKNWFSLFSQTLQNYSNLRSTLSQKLRYFLLEKLFENIYKKNQKPEFFFFFFFFYCLFLSSLSHKQTNKKFGFISIQSQFHNKISRKIPSPSSNRHKSEVFVV